MPAEIPDRIEAAVNKSRHPFYPDPPFSLITSNANLIFTSSPTRSSPLSSVALNFMPKSLEERTQVTEVSRPPVSKELKRRWSYFIRKVYETDPLVYSKCSGEMNIISFIDQAEVIIHAKRI